MRSKSSRLMLFPEYVCIFHGCAVVGPVAYGLQNCVLIKLQFNTIQLIAYHSFILILTKLLPAA
jgi:hypothetical protein